MISVKEVSVYYNTTQVLRNISIDIPEFSMLAVIGPEKSGKTTFLKLFNRLNEVKTGYKITGDISIYDENIFDKKIDRTRRKTGIVFSKPYALPGSVYDNLAFGLLIQNQTNGENIRTKIKEVLIYYKLWAYFEDILQEPAENLSKFKLQLLSLARILMLNPEILLFDQPTKNLSEMAGRKLEAIMFDLKKRHTIILEATNMQQARLSDNTAFFHNGCLIEHSPTARLFTQPKAEITENYIRGKLDW